MSAFKALLKKLGAHENAPLGPLCTLKAGGHARYLLVLKSPEDLKALLHACFEYEINWHILSGGSNTLFSDGIFEGVVIKLGSFFDYVDQESALSLRVGAATSFAKVTKKALSLGWRHAVGWSGTPGLVGGAVRMNAGTRYGEIKDALLCVHGIYKNEFVSFEKENIIFAYRSNNLPTGLVITHVDLAYEQKLISPVLELEQHVLEYRLKRKISQPSSASAGSFFKNPYPHFAAQLIESCSIKGLSYNNAQISSLHANFIINNGGASARDIVHLARTAQQAVWEKHGIKLQPEICLLGNLRENLFFECT